MLKHMYTLSKSQVHLESSEEELSSEEVSGYFKRNMKYLFATQLPFVIFQFRMQHGYNIAVYTTL